VVGEKWYSLFYASRGTLHIHTYIEWQEGKSEGKYNEDG
jgi:hypothetical protein